jgi:uncharacterized protein
MADLKIETISDGVVFTAKVVPGSSKTALAGLYDGMVKIKIAAAPEKGKANECLVEFLSKQLGIPKKYVTVTSGTISPVKKIQVMGLSAAAFMEKLGLNK